MLGKKLLICLVIFYAGHNVLARNIEDVRKEAFEKIEGFMNEHKKQINETLTNLPIREANLKVISKHVRETAGEILNSTMYNIRKSVVSGLLASVLMGNPEKVPPCLAEKEKNSYAESNRYYIQKFINPANEYEKEAEDIQSDDIRAWIQEYNAAVLHFTEIYDRTITDIQKSTEENDILRLVQDFDRTKKDMEKIVTKVNGNLDNLQLQFLLILDDLVFHIRNSLRIRVDRIIVEVRECFRARLTDKMTGPLTVRHHIMTAGNICNNTRTVDDDGDDDDNFDSDDDGENDDNFDSDDNDDDHDDDDDTAAKL